MLNLQFVFGVGLLVCGALLVFVWFRLRSLMVFSQNLTSFFGSFEKSHSDIKEEFFRNRQELIQLHKHGRDELHGTLKSFNDSLHHRLAEMTLLQKSQLDSFNKQLNLLSQTTDQKLEQLRGTLEKQLIHLQEDNRKKLEEMRLTVDEKLHATLEKRLGESFKQVSDRLEQVHKGLGEMQTLANGVGDLKRVLSNVKTRGTWGEVQLGNILEELLTPAQYERNVKTKTGSNDHVEYAIKLPGHGDAPHQPVWLPVDAKFPQDSYEKLLKAQEEVNPDLIAEAVKQMEARVKLDAKNIRDKYLDPPHTTDFGILFLPTEGLYAEILRLPGLQDYVQRECRVLLTGPSNFAALLTSLQMGFKTLAIEKRSSEVWQVLGKVKTEFGKFGELLDKTQKKLQEASGVMDNLSVRSRAIHRSLRSVDTLPTSAESDARLIFDAPPDAGYNT